MPSAEISTDSCHRFLFDQGRIRGEVVHLSSSLKEALARKDYPPALASLLGQALTAVALLADTIKMDGSLILQVQGNGPVNTLVAQATDNGELRGMVHCPEDIDQAGSYRDFVGDGRMVITIDAAGNERYQGVVSIEGDSLAETIDAYFIRSEQLATRIWLASDGVQAGGILLQQMPQADTEEFFQENQWQHLVTMTETVTHRELAELAPQQLLHRLYHQEEVTLYPAAPLYFHCGCSRDKIEAVLIQLGQIEIEQIVIQEGLVRVECEFCNRAYQFDAVDISTLFMATNQPPSLRQ